jgi:hypothetical protein
MSEEQHFEFIVEQLEDGTYLARSFGACIVTEAASLDELRQQVRDAVCCHFDEKCAPGRVVLKFVEVVKREVVDG